MDGRNSPAKAGLQASANVRGAEICGPETPARGEGYRSDSLDSSLFLSRLARRQTLNVEPSSQQTVNGPFPRARENHHERQADGEEVVLESFTLLIA